MEKFITSSKKKPPNDKQITKKLGKMNGIWNKCLKFNDEILLDIDK